MRSIVRNKVTRLLNRPASFLSKWKAIVAGLLGLGISILCFRITCGGSLTEVMRTRELGVLPVLFMVYGTAVSFGLLHLVYFKWTVGYSPKETGRTHGRKDGVVVACDEQGQVVSCGDPVLRWGSAQDYYHFAVPKGWWPRVKLQVRPTLEFAPNRKITCFVETTFQFEGRLDPRFLMRLLKFHDAQDMAAWLYEKVEEAILNSTNVKELIREADQCEPLTQKWNSAMASLSKAVAAAACSRVVIMDFPVNLKYMAVCTDMLGFHARMSRYT